MSRPTDVHEEAREAPATRLRPARPDPADARHFARYLDQAAEGFHGFLLGPDSASITAAAYLEPGHALSHEHTTFAEQEGRVVGMMLAYTGAQQRGFSERPLNQAAADAGGRAALRLKIIRTLLAPMWRILESVKETDFYLHGLAVDPDARGGGIGSLLMNGAEDRGRARGSNRLALDVSAKNLGARRLYARRGMIVASKWPSSRMLPTVMVRMVKDL